MVNMTPVAIEPDIAVMGDCLLHRTHHLMTDECYSPIGDWVWEYILNENFPSLDEVRSKYRWKYEQAMLSDLILESYREEIK